MKMFLPLSLALLLPTVASAEAPEPSRHLGEDEEVCDFQENECLTPQMFLVDAEDSVPLPADTVTIESSTNSRVTFTITQNFGSPSWMVTSYIRPDDAFNSMKCDSEVMAPAAGTSMTYTAKCSSRKASIEFYVHDASYVNATETNNCFADGDVWGDGNNVAMYRMELSCGGAPICGDELAPPELDEVPDDGTGELAYSCSHPKNTARYSLITKGDAYVTALELWGSVSIGGMFSSGNGNGRLRIGTLTEWRSYMFRVIGKCDIDFVGTVKPFQDQSRVRSSTSWAQWYWLAKTLENYSNGDKTIVVKTSGGIFNIDDICADCVKEGHNIVVVFDTDEEVEIVGSPDKPFEASIIAPRAHVKLNGSAVYVGGYIVADSFETVGENQEDLIIKGQTYNGDLNCGATDAPTFAPTKLDKIDNTCLADDILLVNDQELEKFKLPYGTLSLAELDSSSPDFNKTVTFSINQQWTNKIGWMNVAYDQDDGDMYCNDADYVKNMKLDAVKTYTAKCNADGIATVEVFAYASYFKNVGMDNYRNCAKWTTGDMNQRVARYIFDLSCDGRKICNYVAPPAPDEDDEEQEILEGLCNFPGRTKELSIVTKGYADISASEIFSGIAIGGALKNTLGNRVEIASVKKKWSYFLELENDCEMVFNHHVREYTPYTKWLDFAQYEWLAQNLRDMDRDGRRVVVLQYGGDIDLSVYNPECDSKQSGQNFMLVFNTTEDVNLVGSNDSCPYLASILAPFSHVTLMDEAIYLDGFVVANTFETKGDTESSLRIRGNTFNGDLLCWETDAPTASPTSSPTSGPTTQSYKGTNTDGIDDDPDEDETSGTDSDPDEDETSGTDSDPDEDETSGSDSNPNEDETSGTGSDPDEDETSDAGNDPEEDENTPPGDNKAGSNGDPHFRTWRNEHFEYHGQCDMILTKDDTFANGLGIEVQIRTKLVRFWSYIKSAAIRIGDDILEVQGLANPDNDETNYWVNFNYNQKLDTVGGFPVTLTKGGATIRNFKIDLSSKYPGLYIQINTFKEFVRVDFKHGTEEAYGNTVGLLGDFKTGHTLARDGKTVIDDFTVYGNEWQVLPDDTMLFHDISQPQFPKRCIEPEDPRGERRRRLEETTVNIEKAEAACARLSDELDRKDCVYDILATQDLDMIGAF